MDWNTFHQSELAKPSRQSAPRSRARLERAFPERVQSALPSRFITDPGARPKLSPSAFKKQPLRN